MTAGAVVESRGIAREEELAELGVEVGRILLAQAQTLATAESCTGGWIAKTVSAGVTAPSLVCQNAGA